MPGPARGPEASIRKALAGQSDETITSLQFTNWTTSGPAQSHLEDISCDIARRVINDSDGYFTKANKIMLGPLPFVP